MQIIEHFFSDNGCIFIGIVRQQISKHQAVSEDSLSKRNNGSGFNSCRVGLKEFKVLAVIKDIEALFIVTGAEQVFALSGATAYHLPELNL